MNASERLRELDAAIPKYTYPPVRKEDVALRNALPLVIGVVEATEELVAALAMDHSTELTQATCPACQRITQAGQVASGALAALEERLDTVVPKEED